MKQIKRAISLVMAVIMLITYTPVLQAADLADLDRAQMVELQKEILQNIDLNINMVTDPIAQMISRHKYSQEKSAELLKNYITEIDEESIKNIKDQIIQMFEKSVELAGTERYSIIGNNKLRYKVALASILHIHLFSHYDNYRMRHAIFSREPIEFILEGIISLGGFLGSLKFIELLSKKAQKYAISEILAGWALIIGDFSALTFMLWLGEIVIRFFGGAYTPQISPSLSDDETFKILAEQAFDIVSNFEEPDFGIVYNKGPKSAGLLNDIVDIEYYVLRNYNFDNKKDKSFTQTIDWYEMTTEERADYLHNFAERLRSEARAGAKQEFNNLRIGLEAK